MTNQKPNARSFSVKVVSGKAFSIVMKGFQFATSLFFRVAMKIPISFSSTSQYKFSIPINLRKITISITPTKFWKWIFDLNLKKIRIVFVSKATTKILYPISLKIRNSLSAGVITKRTWALTIKKIVIALSPSLAQFFPLSLYDVQTLGALDVKTLDEMDEVSPMGNFTITIASPAVVTLAGAYLGLATGDAVYAQTTGSLPTGVVANTRYYIIYISDTQMNLATSYANAMSGTKINTSGSQSGIHKMYLV